MLLAVINLAASIQQRMKATRQAATFFIQASKVISLSLDQLTYQFNITITFMLTCFISTQKPTSEYVIKALNYDSIDL